MEWVGWLFCVLFAVFATHETIINFTHRMFSLKRRLSFGLQTLFVSIALWFVVFTYAPFEISIK